jgi:hypothetical protein
MAKFRKKPVVIEAEQFTVESKNRVFNWVEGNRYARHHPDGSPYILIETLEGDLRADVGDWVIRGVKGEFYPCKPDIFEATYEPVTEAS